MNKRKLGKISAILLALVCTVSTAVACGKEPVVEQPPTLDPETPAVVLDLPGNDSVEDKPSDEPEVYEETKEGFIRSELTNEWIDESLENQRPIAVMIDNELTALDHYGVNSADVVYEMMNSTANGRVTRLMVLIKDWEKIEQLGSIRSTRPTNVMTAGEWNAILVHDGGPFYIDGYIAQPYCNNLSGGFARFSNGKAQEFTEYVTYEGYTNPSTGKSYSGLGKRIEASGYSTEYNKYYEGAHWNFAKGESSMSKDSKAEKDIKDISLPFPHNKSELKYNNDTKLYEYYEYGKAHIDPLDDNNVTSFTNVILQCMSFTQLDDNGYLCYNVTDSTSHEGYYITKGVAVPITWEKNTPEGITHYYYKSTGEEIDLNTGKTYIAFVPADSWDEVEMK